MKTKTFFDGATMFLIPAVYIIQSGQEMAINLAEAKKRLEEHDPYEQLCVLIATTHICQWHVWKLHLN